jgi:hypothetical protein
MKILLQDLNLPFESFKIKCKTMFLNQSWYNFWNQM